MSIKHHPNMYINLNAQKIEKFQSHRTRTATRTMLYVIEIRKNRWMRVKKIMLLCNQQSARQARNLLPTDVHIPKIDYEYVCV